MDDHARDDQQEQPSPLVAEEAAAAGENRSDGLDAGTPHANANNGDAKGGDGPAPNDDEEERRREEEALARMMAFQEEQEGGSTHGGAASVVSVDGTNTDADTAAATAGPDLVQDTGVDPAQALVQDPNVAFLGPPEEEEEEEEAPHPNLNNPAAVALRRRQALQRAARGDPDARAPWRNAPYPVRKLLSFLRPRVRYTTLSLFAAVFLLCYTLRTRQQFYLALVYLQSSKLAYILLGNAIIALAVSMFGFVTGLFLDGGLRPNERDAIGEHNIRWDVTETCLALTIFRSELDVITAVQFLGLVVMKCLHWSVELRGGHLRMTEEAFAYPDEDEDPAAEPDPAAQAKRAWYQRVPRLRFTHMRYYFLVQILLLVDILGVAHCALSVATHGPSVDILFGFESAILLVSGLSAAGMYNLHVIDGIMGVFHHLAEGGHHHVPVGGMAEPNANDLLEDSGEADGQQEQEEAQEGGENDQQDEATDQPPASSTNRLAKVLVERLANPWRDRRATLSFAIELQAQAAKFLFYVVFFAIVFTYYGMPINIFREVYVSFQQLRRRLVAFNTYRRLTHNMDKRFESISDEEELDRLGHTCIICRDSMDVTGGCKKLPGCGHAFHAHCLREWLVQQQTCPTCRADIAANEAREKKRKERERAAEAAAAAVAPTVDGTAEGAADNTATTEVTNDIAATDAAQRQALETSRTDESQSQDQAREQASATAAAAAAAGSPEQQAAPSSSSTPASGDASELPPGWTQHVDDSGRTYYHNREVGESTWDKPTVKMEEAPSSTEQDANAAVSSTTSYTGNQDRKRPPPSQPKYAAGFPCLYRVTFPSGAPIFSPNCRVNYMGADIQQRTIPCGKLIACTAIEYWPMPFQEAMLRMPEGFVRCRDVERFMALPARAREAKDEVAR